MPTRQSKPMYIIIWAYQVKSEHLANFVEIYSNDGAWAKLFGKSEGYLATELLHDETDTLRFVTIDRWVSAASYLNFKAQWQAEYNALDAQCEGMTEQEVLIGRYSQPI